MPDQRAASIQTALRVAALTRKSCMMTSSDSRPITDELLSAYLDGMVTDHERALVDAAIQTDPTIIWRLDSLRQTVTLLRALPELTLPRTFTLQLDQVREGLTSVGATGGSALHPPRVPVPPRSWKPRPWKQWRAGWRSFWQMGNPLLRNAAAASLAALLLISSGAPLLSRALAPAGMLPDAGPLSAPAAESASAAQAAPDPADVALAPQATAAEVVAVMSAPAEAVTQEASTAEAAPVAEPSLALAPAPMILPASGGMGGGMGGGMSASSMGAAPALGGGELVPEQTHTFEVAPETEAPETEAPESAVARAAAESTEPVTEESRARKAPAATESKPTQAAPTATAAATVAAVAVGQPPAPTPPTAATASPESARMSPTAPPAQVGLPVVAVAQGVSFLLTIVLGALWWRSRRPSTSR
jgi:anti-sigma factor RsiW